MQQRCASDKKVSSHATRDCVTNELNIGAGFSGWFVQSASAYSNYGLERYLPSDPDNASRNSPPCKPRRIPLQLTSASLDMLRHPPRRKSPAGSCASCCPPSPTPLPI